MAGRGFQCHSNLKAVFLGEKGAHMYVYRAYVPIYIYITYSTVSPNRVSLARSPIIIYINKYRNEAAKNMMMILYPKKWRVIVIINF